MTALERAMNHLSAAYSALEEYVHTYESQVQEIRNRQRVEIGILEDQLAELEARATCLEEMLGGKYLEKSDDRPI